MFIALSYHLYIQNPITENYNNKFKNTSLNIRILVTISTEKKSNVEKLRMVHLLDFIRTTTLWILDPFFS